MGMPPQRKGAVICGTLECDGVDRVMIFGVRFRPGHHAAWKYNGGIVGAGGASAFEQSILAGAAWADHENKPSRTEPAGIRRNKRLRFAEPVHATRLPFCQTVRTIGTS
jgi:hypothetical protein